MMNKLLIVGAGGAVGALLRYALSGAAYRLLGTSFPWGTLAVNMIGCYLIGIGWALVEESTLAPNSRLFLLTGILGAFTTFSTFGLETINLFRDGEAALALTNVLVSNVLGLALVLAGFYTARLIAVTGGAR